MSQYRKGYIFEKKTNAHVQEILSKYKELKFYSIESRGSKGSADIVFGIYNKRQKLEFGLESNVKEAIYQMLRKREIYLRYQKNME